MSWFLKCQISSLSFSVVSTENFGVVIWHFKNRYEPSDKLTYSIHHHYIVLKTRGLPTLKENLVQQNRQMEAEAFIEKYRVKGGNHYCQKTRKTKIPVIWGGVPEAAVQVRKLDKKGVDEVVVSFLQMGVKLPMEIVGVIWVNPANSNLNIDNLILDLSQPKPPAYIHIVCGGHRTQGLIKCHGMFPLKILYKFYYVTILIVPRTQANISLLLYIGNSDNRKTQVFVKTTQWSIVQQFRRNLKRFDDDESLTKKERNDAFAAYKLETQPESGFTANTCHTFSAICCVHETVWDLMERIFNGEFIVNKELKGQKKPDAVTHFTSMSGIPNHKLISWLQRILDGEWLTSTFLKRCNIYKKAEKVSAQILEYIAIQRPKYMFTTMSDVAKVYPAVAEASWFDGVVASCEDAVKAKLSPHAQKMIDDMMEAKEESDLEQKVYSLLRVFVFFCICNYHFLHVRVLKHICVGRLWSVQTLFGRSRFLTFT